MLKNELGENIKKRRKELGISQEKLAMMLGYKNRASICFLESGKHNLNTKQIKEIAEVLKISVSDLIGAQEVKRIEWKQIPIVGSIPAGVPVEAIEDIEGYTYMNKAEARGYDYFALKARGDSMAPYIMDGDTLLFRKQNQAENGDICCVYVDGYEATVKKIKYEAKGLVLIPNNPSYDIVMHSNKELRDGSVSIGGKLVRIERHV